MKEFEPKPYQKKAMDAIISGGKMTGIYRRARPYGLTISQLDTFNRICKEGERRIQWHAPEWVAMDRKSFEKLLRCHFDFKIDELVEKKYQLCVEHNHSTMKWYAYYAGKHQRGLFDEDIDWYTESDTPTGAINKLRKLLEEGKL